MNAGQGGLPQTLFIHFSPQNGLNPRIHSTGDTAKEAEFGEEDNGAPDSFGGFEDFPLKTTASF